MKGQDERQRADDEVMQGNENVEDSRDGERGVWVSGVNGKLMMGEVGEEGEGGWLRRRALGNEVLMIRKEKGGGREGEVGEKEGKEQHN